MREFRVALRVTCCLVQGGGGRKRLCNGRVSGFSTKKKIIFFCYYFFFCESTLTKRRKSFNKSAPTYLCFRGQYEIRINVVMHRRLKICIGNSMQSFGILFTMFCKSFLIFYRLGFSPHFMLDNIDFSIFLQILIYKIFKRFS